MNSQLEQALQRAGFQVKVESREGLAVLIPLARGAIASDDQRRSVLALAAKHGFSHVALELID